MYHARLTPDGEDRRSRAISGDGTEQHALMVINEDMGDGVSAHIEKDMEQAFVERMTRNYQAVEAVSDIKSPTDDAFRALWRELLIKKMMKVVWEG